jgi:hypothetical protein
MKYSKHSEFIFHVDVINPHCATWLWT